MKKNNEDTLYIAKTFAGLEEVLAGELTSQGADAISKMKRAVSFRGDKRLLYTANLKLRTALRILKPIFTCRAKDEDALYGQCKEFEWERLLDIEQTFAVDSVVFSEYFKHSKYAALKLKDAIADRFRQRVGKRPSVDTLNPGIRIHLHISADRINVSLDSSGDSLHKRGYRDTRHIAPMNEALAAGLLKVSNWTGTLPLIDPMCGSGTIPFEAAMLAAGIPPGIRRSTYGFMHWNDFDEQLWREVREEALAQASTPGVEIIAADASAKSLDIARSSAIRFGLNHLIKFKRSGFDKLHAGSSKGILIMNPPYGKRMKDEDLHGLYKMIGDKLKQHFTGFDAWILSSNKEAIKHIGLRSSERHTLYNGPLECKFLKFPLYAGRKN